MFLYLKSNTQYFFSQDLLLYWILLDLVNISLKSPLPPFEHIQIKFSDFMHHILIKQPIFTIEQSNFLYIIEIWTLLPTKHHYSNDFYYINYE